MGSISDAFSTISDVLLAERVKAETEKRRHAGRDILTDRLLNAILPRSVRSGPGIITDLKDRRVGPIDVVASWDAYPALGDRSTTVYMADSVAFCIQARNWSVDDLTAFGEEAAQLKSLERKRPEPMSCFAVSYESLSLPNVSDFLNSKAGLAVDGVLTIGHHVIVRNSLGFYGSPTTIPFVTERSAPEALKAFSFLLLRLTHQLVGLPFAIADYQHL